MDFSSFFAFLNFSRTQLHARQTHRNQLYLVSLADCSATFLVMGWGGHLITVCMQSRYLDRCSGFGDLGVGANSLVFTTSDLALCKIYDITHTVDKVH